MRTVSAIAESPNSGMNTLRSLRIGLPDDPHDEQSAYAARFVDTGSSEPLPAARPSTTKQIPCKCGVWVPSEFSGLFVVSPKTGVTLTIPNDVVDRLPPRVRARIVRVGKCGTAMFTPYELHEIHRLSNIPMVFNVTRSRSPRRCIGFGGRWSQR